MITSSHSSSVGSTHSLVLSPRLSITKLPDAIGSSPLSDDHADEVADLWVNKRRRMSTDSTSEPPSSTVSGYSSYAESYSAGGNSATCASSMDFPYNTYSSFNYLGRTTSALWRPPMLLLVGIVGVHPDPWDPCHSSGSLGSLPFIRILGIPAIHPDPHHSSKSSPLTQILKILTTHPDPWDPYCSSRSLPLIRILTTHPDSHHSSGFSPLIRILTTHPDSHHSSGFSPLIWILTTHPDPHRSPESSRSSPLIRILGILGAHPDSCQDPHHSSGSSPGSSSLIKIPTVCLDPCCLDPLQDPRLDPPLSSSRFIKIHMDPHLDWDPRRIPNLLDPALFPCASVNLPASDARVKAPRLSSTTADRSLTPYAATYV